MKLNEDILAVIVLYKTKLNDSKTFVSLTKSLQVDNLRLSVLVYDNSPDFNKHLKNDHPNWDITYVPDLNNSGVSKAYNIGCDIADRQRKKWIILFDQDTLFPQNSINQYINEIENYPDYKLFAPIIKIQNGTIISPCNFSLMRGSSLKQVNIGFNNLNKLSVINCGMCVNVVAFKKNKGYNELIKLDFSDHDFIDRFKKSVTSKFIVIDLEVMHELSTANRNSLNSDLLRFDYYLNGGRRMASSKVEKLFFKFNSLSRSLRLFFRHKNLSFFIKALK